MIDEVQMTLTRDGALEAFFRRVDGKCFWRRSQFEGDPDPVLAVLTEAGILCPIMIEREEVLPRFWGHVGETGLAGEIRTPLGRPLRALPHPLYVGLWPEEPIP